MHAVRTLLALALLVSATMGSGAHAADPHTGILADPTDIITWVGEFHDVAAAAPEACDVAVCDVFTAVVDLPAGTWDTPGGILFAIRSETMELFYNLDLYVYGPDGALAGRSDDYYFNHEAVLVPDASNGEYRVVVVPAVVVGDIEYEGVAHIEFAPPVEPVRDLLPNLVPRPPSNFHFETGAGAGFYYYSARFGGAPSSCYPSEIASGARRCLRFDQTVANFGDGPLELQYHAEPDMLMRQRIHRSDATTHDETVGAIQWHAVHGHFHYAGFSQAFLYHANPDGSADGLLRTGNKTGFCMVDSENYRFGQPGDSPKTWHLAVCDEAMNIGNAGTAIQMGISPGWGDTYPWFVADQYIEVSGVPDGTYVLELRVNIDGAIEEGSSSDNSTSVLIRLDGDTAEAVT